MIDRAAAEGGGARVVLVARGKVAVSFSLQLRSNVVLVIDGTLSTDGNPHSAWNGHRALLQGTNVFNTTITGSGTIDGKGVAWWPIRKKQYSFFAPSILYCYRCSHLTFSRLKIRNTPAWGVEFSEGKAILVDGIDSESPRDSPNTDGVGLSCIGGPDQPCVLRNSKIYNGDDEVAVSGSNVSI
jgi:polygalacturonase